MNERFRALLDDAVSDLEPASPDPVPAIVGRGRAARRRAIAAGALAVAVLAGGGVTAGVRLADRPAPDTSTVAAEPPTPGVVGRTVVAGDVHLPVPDGWRVVVADRKKGQCGEFKKTVLIHDTDRDTCGIAPIEIAGTAQVYPPGRGAVDGKTIFALPPSQYTLRGGAPAWLADPVTDEMNDPARHAAGAAYWNTLILPWSKVRVTMRVSGPEQQRILDSISVTPAPRAGRLVLQGKVAEATLARAGSGGAKPVYRSVTDARSIDAVLRLLRAQKKTVDSGHACTGPDQPAARLTLRQDGLPQPGPSGMPRLTVNPITTVIISLGDCREAVSSNGGRVRMSQDTVDELARLFGMSAR